MSNTEKRNSMAPRWRAAALVVLALFVAQHMLLRIRAGEATEALARRPSPSDRDGEMSVKAELESVHRADVRTAPRDLAPRAVNAEPSVPESGLLRGVLLRPDALATAGGHKVALIELGGDGAPMPDVVELARAELVFFVYGAGGLLEDADVLVECEAGRTRFQSSAAPSAVSLPPRTEVTVSVKHTTHATLRRTELTGDVGQRLEVVLVLEPVTRPSLRVRLPGASATGLERLQLDLLAHESDAEEQSIEVARTTVQDEFGLDALPAAPGPHTLRLRSVAAFRSEVLEVEVPSQGILSAKFRGACGGRVEVQLRSALARWSAEWTIRNESGADAIPARHESHDGTGNMQWSASESAMLARRELRPDTDVLAPGRYTLEVRSPEHKMHAERFEIETGARVELRVRLKANGAD